MAFEELKSPFQSLTIWGCLGALVAGADQLYKVIDQIPVGVLPPNVAAIIAVVGPILGIVGRINATKSVRIPSGSKKEKQQQEEVR